MIKKKIYTIINQHSDDHHCGVELANLLILLVFLSWSLIFFSISASVNVSKNGHQLSASCAGRIIDSTVGNGDSLINKDYEIISNWFIDK
jgi:hypothetical protein